MSLLHPEEARECQRCGHRWLAEKWSKLDAQQPLLGVGITARAQDLHRQTVHERRDRLHRTWRYCPGCGSKKAKTLKGPDADLVGLSSTNPAPGANSQFGVDVSATDISEQRSFSVLLLDLGPKKIQVIKALRSVTKLPLRQAKELVEQAPVVVSAGLDSDRAKRLREQLESAGAVAELREAIDENTGGPDQQVSPQPSLSVADELEKLSGLLDRGILSKAEFDAAKERLLSPKFPD